MSTSISNTRKTQPMLPVQLSGIPQLDNWARQLQADLYPQLQNQVQNVPTITGLSNGKVTGGNVRQGRNWTVSLTIVPLASGPSVASSASLTLPFAAANTAVFQVTHGGVLLPAMVEQGTSTLNLPNWSTTDTVTIYGKADE